MEAVPVARDAHSMNAFEQKPIEPTVGHVAAGLAKRSMATASASAHVLFLLFSACRMVVLSLLLTCALMLTGRTDGN